MYANARTQSQTYTCKHPLYPDTIYVTPAASCLKLVPWTSLSTSLGHTVGVLQSNVCTKVIQFQCQRSRHRRKGRLSVWALLLHILPWRGVSVLSTPATHFTMKGCICSEHSCYTFYHEGVYLFWALLLHILPWRGVSVLSTPATHFTMKGCICSEHSCYTFYHEGVYLFWALLLHILPWRGVSVLSTPATHFAKEWGICSEHSYYTFCQGGRYLFWALPCVLIL